MLFSFRKRDPEGPEVLDWASEFARSEERSKFLLMAAQGLAQCLQEFALDLTELDGSEFRAALAETTPMLAGEEKISRLQSRFNDRTQVIKEYARRQKGYWRDREKEFKDIIDILSKAMAAVDLENREYNRSISEHSQRLEEVTRLDDIKRLKRTLLQEVEHLREAVREKESRDLAKIEKLSLQVSVLNRELESAKSESERDSLTGICNRRAFDRHLADLIARNAVQDRPFALMMIDIDNFKRINDAYGHLAGDRVLVTLANKFRQSVRGQDLLARYGGEEFVILLQGASLRNAIKKSRQICELIASTRYLLEGMPSWEALTFTVSIGVSAWCRGDTSAALLDRADKALYAAKDAGKNRAFSEKDIA
jgi:diguanylate cyclase